MKVSVHVLNFLGHIKGKNTLCFETAITIFIQSKDWQNSAASCGYTTGTNPKVGNTEPWSRMAGWRRRRQFRRAAGFSSSACCSTVNFRCEEEETPAGLTGVGPLLHCPLVRWPTAPLVQCATGPLVGCSAVCCCAGPLVCCSAGPLSAAALSAGLLVPCSAVCCSAGLLVPCSTVPPVRCPLPAALLLCCSAGLLVHCPAAPLFCWSAGLQLHCLLLRWSCLLVRCSAGPEVLCPNSVSC